MGVPAMITQGHLICVHSRTLLGPGTVCDHCLPPTSWPPSLPPFTPCHLPTHPQLLDIQQNDTWAWHPEPTSSGPNFTPCYSFHPRDASLQSQAPHQRTPLNKPPLCHLEKSHSCFTTQVRWLSRAMAYQDPLSTSSCPSGPPKGPSH